MNQTWLTIVLLAIVTFALKGFGPILLGDRRLPARLTRLADDLPAPLLAALVAISAFTAGTDWSLDARAVGLAAAGLALWKKLPFVVVVIVAAAATALVRAL
ncbi:MAG TPA: AzlD domain-containing protein [Acidimicrobiia bacterium]|jgi:branched-subunit amino acid transport protein